MRTLRLAAAATSLTLISAVSSIGAAQAAETPGVGTTQAATTLLGIQLGSNGSLLNLRLVGDDARATIDKLVAPTEAFSKLTPLSVSSSVVPALNVALPTLESRAPGGNGNVQAQAINLNSAVPGLGALPVSVVGGTLNLGSLTSSVDGGVAKSALDIASGNIDLVGGLLSVNELSSKLGATAGSTQADGFRGVKAGSIEVLNLGDLLEGLGLDLTDLPLASVTGLLSQLGVTVPGIGNGADVQATLNGILAEIDTVTATLAGAGVDTSTVTTVVDTLGLGSVIDTGVINAIGDPVARATELVEQLQAVLGGLLDTVLNVLDDVSLLEVDGIEVGVVTKAVKDLNASVADVTAKIGNVNVAGLALPGVDLGSTITQVNGLVKGVNDKLSSTLGAINPGLAGLVNVSVLEEVTSVVNEGGYNRTRAGISALTASIKPPAELAGIIGTLKSGVGVGDLIAQAGLPLPGVGDSMAGLENTLGGAVQALAGGATIKVAEVMAASDFAVAGAAPIAAPGGELPRTGGTSTGLLALVAAGMAGMALAVRRFTRMPVATK